MHISRVTWLLPCCLALMPGSPVYAQTAKPAPFDPTANTALSVVFLEGHPDLRFRIQGLEAYGQGEYAKAIERFRQAAYFGDKASQAIVGEMLWAGLGTERDRVLALAWMDLAAEREYPRFVNTRNGYWNALSPKERQRARDLVDSIYDQYGDAAADPRLARVLRRERAKMSGSRVGSQTSSVQILVPGHGSIDASQLYNPQFWELERYRAWHDAFWENMREGKIEVGDLEQVEGAKAPRSAPPSPKDIKPQ